MKTPQVGWTKTKEEAAADLARIEANAAAADAALEHYCALHEAGVVGDELAAAKRAAEIAMGRTL